MNPIKGIFGLGFLIVGLLVGALALLFSFGVDVIPYVWIGPALIAFGLLGMAQCLLRKRPSRFLFLLLFASLPVAGAVVLDFQIRKTRGVLQAQSREFLARPAPSVTRADAEGIIGGVCVGPHMDGLANCHDLIERYAKRGRIRWSATINGQFANVGFETRSCERAAENDMEAQRYITDCRSLVHRINRMGFWQFIEDTMELKLICPEYIEQDAPVSDGMTQEENRRIAEGLLAIMYSPMATEQGVYPDPRLPENERQTLTASDIDLNDPRLPEAVRALKPVQIWVTREDVSLMRTTKPEHFTLSRNQTRWPPAPTTPNTWFLTVAGTGVPVRDLLRIEHE